MTEHAINISGSHEYWTKLATTSPLPSELWIGGEWRSARHGRSTPLTSPGTGMDVTHVAAAQDADVDDAVRGALDAFKNGPWAKMNPRDRGDVLIRWADLVEENRDEVAMLISVEMGKPISVAWEVELKTGIALLRWYGELADKLMDESPRGRAESIALVTREPLGVVAAITPWNFPITLSLFKIPAALVSGNSVVLKPASQSPLSALRLAELGTQAGLPAGVFNVITGSGSLVGKALATHPDVATLTFTGSTGVGKQLLHYAGDSNAKPIWLELGGKSANIIFPDAPDLSDASATAAWAIWFNSGQMCTAGSRLLVHRSVHDQVVDDVVRHFKSLKIGDPLDPETQVGPLSSKGHQASVASEVATGIASGARLVHGSDMAPSGTGFFFPPAMFDDVHPDSRLAQHEIFGPVLSVIPFADEAEAIDIANNSDFGLGSAVWTSDIGRVHRVSRNLQAGLVWVNCFEEGDASVPFGGRKLSGHGVDKSAHGIDKYTALKTTWIKL
ncbi:aldehyde dehydrogenase family protein [Rhodococcus wratislaviensis]|uniref:aldehyde dehydrogenase family protein n=1 Tax=Rhodococcus wratislaviensis TaxID=44752 RepID=UPI00365E66F0